MFSLPVKSDPEHKPPCLAIAHLPLPGCVETSRLQPRLPLVSLTNHHYSSLPSNPKLTQCCSCCPPPPTVTLAAGGHHPTCCSHCKSSLPTSITNRQLRAPVASGPWCSHRVTITPPLCTCHSSTIAAHHDGDTSLVNHNRYIHLDADLQSCRLYTTACPATNYQYTALRPLPPNITLITTAIV